MKIRNRLNPSNPCFSFEFFPPKTDEGVANLLRTLEDLAPLEPGFVSVTYGAGGSTRDRTLELVSRIKQQTGIEAMAHLTCVGHTREELRDVLQRLADAKLDNVLVLRGDPPQGQTTFQPTEGGFSYASELVRFIREEDFNFCLGGACYPEGHVETASRDDDLRHLKAKVDAGLDFVVTQLFFDNAFYFDFVERARRAGINIPIVPGIMPITNYEQVQRFTRMCGATVPMRLGLQLERVKDQPEALVQLGVAHATVQCMELLSRGVPGIHFYTLNKSPATRMIVSALRAHL
ncbi:methylenetetrahydrofolate reductase [NAD(P)H] [Myxococcus sp. MISCRS1]|uniref:methylenetetrahydrofolate reductase [NAD(P)H] n=1 Tax=Myxococcus TaxID=32 RepID=UPI001CBED2BB|nr:MULTISPECIES: methylenetetrahydrofolate reductase [NAD(P)H] [unclassified Myxococcus]MBZ4399932.1 methylenetetrahydrofolate reductase [NAD(P)H] [Myxococcus sp. AS-1-15]MBZ4414225.1 methylenetetrahydrofolate reductase [NAD(P)H] [Myxococcus sp. XM-1-1-1]MCY0995988.1 methylenetetrahydrofolate reductase [NAD(P)H] [Myxococcus sp. MISCRS1]BDT34031.1 methylenetetrahydrofolate reductase [NAD(P)H] [Myxococcus sp. MH1]